MTRKLKTGAEQLNFTLSLIHYLNNVDHEVTVAETVKHFGVSEADVVRSLSQLTTAGFITASSGTAFERIFYNVFPVNEDEDDFTWRPETEISFAPDFDTDLLDAPSLSTSQLSALIAGLQYLRSLPNVAMAGEIDALIARLTAGKQQDFVTNIEYRPGTVSATIAQLRDAILQKKRIRCDYTNQQGESSRRELDPVRIDPRNSNWQLRAWCHKNDAGRNFRVDHIRNIEILDEPWCAEAFELQSTDEADYIEHETDLTVVVEVDPEAYSLIGDFNGSVTSIDKQTLAKKAELKIGNLPYFGRMIARYGGAARVISPASAREVVRDFALEALEAQNSEVGQK